MARQTRQQRQARRAQDGATEKQPTPAPERAVPRQAQLRPATDGPRHDVERHIPGSGVKRFVAESWGELKKVEWPNQSQVIQGTIVVLIACIIVGIFLYASDQAFKNLVEKVFLR
jgi:preprotein translocase subunit SecE